jgi:hypothetical protein
VNGPILIGLTGKAGSGKDTVADYLAASRSFAKIAFADPIRRGIGVMFGLPPTSFQHPHKEEAIASFGKSPRQMMQTLGTEWGRNLVHPDVWLILAKELTQTNLGDGQSVVITDVRFENEAQLIRSLGGVIWHLNRTVAGTQHSHISESGIDFAQGDRYIGNNNSIADLHAFVDWSLT